MMRTWNSEAANDDVKDKFAAIQNQLQKLMEGMTIINDSSSKTDHELGKLKEILKTMEPKDKDEEESSQMNRRSEGSYHATSSGNALTRFSRLDFPKISSFDLRTWLYKVEQIFATDEIPSEQKVKIASIHLEGEAIAWHRIIEFKFEGKKHVLRGANSQLKTTRVKSMEKDCGVNRGSYQVDNLVADVRRKMEGK
ncbi:unnamed protein product [Cuscuta campestris]|uniref:Retrotransposon gag domain-containing protein n=1 Tax=Cuscuta campestris TaxID=132261 RepID=A0A484NBG2_9ASTE|nr:unnamed protein product [Cuscuta campestris]